MANTTVVQVSIVVLITFSVFFMNLQATSLHGHPLAHKKLASQRLLHKLGIDPSNHVHIRVDDDTPGSGDRLSPGGPDPQHNHGKSPTKN